MSTLIFFIYLFFFFFFFGGGGVAYSEMGSAILKKGEITLYSQKTESRNTNFKSIKYGLISEDKWSDTFL